MAAVASPLRSHKPVSMFGTHYVIVQICDPLSAASGQIEVSCRLAKMHRHAVPIEPRIFFDEIGGRRIPQLPVGADFLELAKQGICLAWIEWVPQLPNQVRRLN